MSMASGMRYKRKLFSGHEYHSNLIASRSLSRNSSKAHHHESFGKLKRIGEK